MTDIESTADLVEEVFGPRRVSRREQDRIDAAADAQLKRDDLDAAAQRRRDDQAAAEKLRQDQQRFAREEKSRAEREKTRQVRERREARRQRRRAAAAHIAEHMPLTGLPVVLVSMVMGWSGQAQAAAALGMGWASVGVPVITEGMTLTLAGMTAQAITAHRPHGRLLVSTWVAAVFAAVFNACGHLAQDHSLPGIYRACGYAVSSTAAMILWGRVMRAKRVAVSGRTAEDEARWRRLRRQHPVITRRARRISDATGADATVAWLTAWTRTHGAAPGEPTRREIRRARRSAYLRAKAESWDGRRGWRRNSVPAATLDDHATDAETITAKTEPETPTAPPTETPPPLPALTFLPLETFLHGPSMGVSMNPLSRFLDKTTQPPSACVSTTSTPQVRASMPPRVNGSPRTASTGASTARTSTPTRVLTKVIADTAETTSTDPEAAREERRAYAARWWSAKAANPDLKVADFYTQEGVSSSYHYKAVGENPRA